MTTLKKRIDKDGQMCLCYAKKAVSVQKADFKAFR